MRYRIKSDPRIEPPKSNSELMRAIYTANRKRQFFEAIFVLVVCFTLTIVAVGEYYQIRKLQDQTAQRGAGIQKILDSERDENSKQTRYIQCIAQFFATTDRSTRVLTNLDDCNIQQNGQQVPGVNLTPTSPLVQPAAASSSVQPATSTQNVGDDDTNVPISSNPGGSTTTNPQQTANPVQITLPLPTPLNSIPLCVRVLNVCVSN